LIVCGNSILEQNLINVKNYFEKRGDKFLSYYDKVKTLCESEGISIFRLESELEIGNGTIGRWKNKNSTPSIQVLKKISEYFKLPLSYFLEDE